MQKYASLETPTSPILTESSSDSLNENNEKYIYYWIGNL